MEIKPTATAYYYQVVIQLFSFLIKFEKTSEERFFLFMTTKKLRKNFLEIKKRQFF